MGPSARVSYFDPLLANRISTFRAASVVGILGTVPAAPLGRVFWREENVPRDHALEHRGK